MSYPAPTQPPKQQAATKSVSRSTSVFQPYPPVTDGRNIPALIKPLPMVRIKAGDTFQLKPILNDLAGKEQTPTERFRYSSNNPQINVSSTGLITTNCNPNVVSRRGSSVTGIVTVSYGSVAPVITQLVHVLVSTDWNDLISD